MSDVHVIKEGLLKKRGGKQDKPSGNWNTRYFILHGGSLYYYQSQTDEAHKGVVQLKDSHVEELLEKDTKRPFCFAIHTASKQFWVCAENESNYQEWLQAIKDHLGQPALPPPDRPKVKGLVFRAQKQVAEKAVNTGLGKDLLKKYLPDDTWFLLESLKRMVKTSINEEKSKELEHRILKIAVKTAMLYNGGHLTEDVMLTTCKQPVLKMWELFIDCCDDEKKKRKKESEPGTPTSSALISSSGGSQIKDKDNKDKIAALSTSIREAGTSFEQLLSSHISAKSIQQMKETLNYFSGEEVLRTLLRDDRNAEDLDKCACKLHILKSMFLWYQ